MLTKYSHVNKQEYDSADADEWRKAYDDQVVVINAQWQARNALSLLEHQVPDNLIAKECWLRGFESTNAPNCLPLAKVADRWFDLVLLQQDPDFRCNHNDARIDELETVIQSLVAQRSDDHKRSQAHLEYMQRDWETRHDEQTKKYHSLQKELTKVDLELKKLQHRYSKLQDEYDASERRNEKMKRDNERLRNDLARSEQERQDMARRLRTALHFPDSETKQSNQKSELAELKNRMAILEGENASMKRDQEKLEADNSVLQAEKATLEADIRALVEHKQVHPVTNQDHGRTASRDYGPPSSYTTRKSNPRYPPTAFAAPPEWRNHGRRASIPAPTPETPSRPPSAVSQATSHTLVNNSRAQSVEKSSERGGNLFFTCFKVQITRLPV